MKKVYTYTAFAGSGKFDGESLHAYVCQAVSKKQMKFAGMNMKLDWVRHNSYNEALASLLGYEIKRECNISNYSQF